MNLLAIASLWALPTLVILTCLFLWSGLNGLIKIDPRRPWSMLSGAMIYTLGAVALALSLAETYFGKGDLPLSFVALLFLLVGNLVFAIGFSFHGHKGRRLQQRIEELEMMNLAQATELERLRNR